MSDQVTFDSFIYRGRQGRYGHPFHIVQPSGWPFLVSFFVLFFVLSFVVYAFITVGNPDYFFPVVLSFCFVFCGALAWWYQIIVEEKTGNDLSHNLKVEKGLRMGMYLFIVSEIMFFFGFFWAFFHSSVSPAIQIGAVWVPKGIVPFNPWEIPLLNSIILLSSGVTVTWAHYAILSLQQFTGKLALVYTVALGIIFTLFQGVEYVSSSFDISDGVFGSCFFLLTGFHGFHVLIGTVFLFVCLLRFLVPFTRLRLTSYRHFALEAAIWYWHFVDVVWLFLFICVYWWGGL